MAEFSNWRAQKTEYSHIIRTSNFVSLKTLSIILRKKVQELVSWLYYKLYTQISFHWQVSVNYETTSSWKSLHITTCFTYSILQGSAPTERGKHAKACEYSYLLPPQTTKHQLDRASSLLDARNHLNLRTHIYTLQNILPL